MSSNIITEPRNIVFSFRVDSDLNFKDIMAITDPKAALPAFEMIQFFQTALEQTDDNALEFNVVTAVNLIKANPKYALMSYRDDSLFQQDNTVSAMVDKVVSFLKNMLQVSLPPAKEEDLKVSIENTFTNLDVQRESAWIFWRSEQAESTSYQYNILFAVQNENTGLFLYGMPVGLTIKASIQKKKILFITLKDYVSYSVRVQALKVVQFLQP